MKSSIPKQFIPICGKPILYHTIKNIAVPEFVEEIILVLPEEYMGSSILNSCIPEDLSVPIRFQKGGAGRQDSVFNGLQALSEDVMTVLVHDGVRPFVRKMFLKACLDKLEDSDGVIPVIRMKDTLKKIKDGFIENTLNREEIAGAQTPQVFKKDALIRAYQYAFENGLYGTDDASLVEVAGGKVRVVEGDEINIKITTPFDVALAEWILEKGFFNEKS
ncbi:MAG: 2-C-methyl-D-erythritol 4-phosphate cytidylyltransferase [Candidatus Marinimicrobia bacterium]|nr:2-C-methyl-D-erythritol 4-phosphate cytidylyltransferase [Candidatus Neomarinimicrobiota bacterium]